jgi:hypothetical protein
MNREELKTILDEHKLWTGDRSTGKLANLSGANLSGANLSGAHGMIAILNVGSRGDMLIAVMHDIGIMYKTGCFWGTEEEFTAAVNKHKDEKHKRTYLAAIEMIKSGLGA